jgi:K+ transporter
MPNLPNAQVVVHGEGGILALMSLLPTKRLRRRLLVAMGLFGAALNLWRRLRHAPKIALEGLKVVADVFKPHIAPMALSILFGLFAIQSRGTVSGELLILPEFRIRHTQPGHPTARPTLRLVRAVCPSTDDLGAVLRG